MIYFTAVDITRRLSSFRTEFTRILRVGPSGRGADGEVDPGKLHFKDKVVWDRLCFLKDHIRARDTISSAEVSIIHYLHHTKP